MPKRLDQQIHTHIQTLVDELALLVKRAAIQSVRSGSRRTNIVSV